VCTGFFRTYGLIIFITTFLLSCSEEIEQGKFIGLEIGMTKLETIEVLQAKNNVQYVRPEVKRIVEVSGKGRKNEQLMESLLSGEGVVVEGRSDNIYIRISFDNDMVNEMHIPPVSKGDDLGIEIGMKKEDVKTILNDAFSIGKIRYAYNYLPNSRWLNLDTLNENEKNSLFVYDTWIFSESDKFSHVTLEFYDDKLERIIYKWTPIELP
jgi:hypothetical protein